MLEKNSKIVYIYGYKGVGGNTFQLIFFVAVSPAPFRLSGFASLICHRQPFPLCQSAIFLFLYFETFFKNPIASSLFKAVTE